MSIGLLVFASVSGGTAWIVDSLFDCNLDAWPKGWGEVPELSVENSRFQEHFDGDVGTIAAPQDPSTAQDNVMSLKLLGAKTISGVAPGVLEESQGLDMSMTQTCRPQDIVADLLAPKPVLWFANKGSTVS